MKAGGRSDGPSLMLTVSCGENYNGRGLLLRATSGKVSRNISPAGGLNLEMGLSVLDETPVAGDLGEQSYDHDPDVQLMLRVKGGDDEAFTQLVAGYQDRLIGIFYHLLQDLEAAKDLAQDVFLRVYRARHTYQPTAKFSTWLFRIANNLASNSRRSQGRRREVPLNMSDSGPLGPRPEERLLAEKSALMPVRQLVRTEMREIVRTALEDLNERQRMAVLLHKFEGMSYADIATAMDLSTPAVKSLLSRARESLRAKLEQHIK